MTHIIVCDDSREDLALISTIIKSFYDGTSDRLAAVPYLLSCFSDPAEVLAYAEDGNKIDVAILDIMMPDINGVELASGLRDMGFEGYLIFLTTFNDFAAQSYAVKAFSYMLKSAKEEEFFDLLQNIENMRRATDRNGFILTCRNETRLILFSELMYAEVMASGTLSPLTTPLRDTAAVVSTGESAVAVLAVNAFLLMANVNTLVPV